MVLVLMLGCLTEASFAERFPRAYCRAAEDCGELAYDDCMAAMGGRDPNACTDGGGSFSAKNAAVCLDYYDAYVCDGSEDGALEGQIPVDCSAWCE